MVFRLSLNARLDAVEQIKAYHDQEYRSSCRTMRIVFAAGVLVGVALAILVLFHPFDLPTLRDLTPITPPSRTSGDRAYLSMIIFGALVAAVAIVLPLTLSRRHRSRFMGL